MIKLCKANKVVDSIKHSIKNIKRSKKDDRYSNYLERSIKYIRASHKFYIGDIDEMMNIYKWKSNDLPFFTMGNDLIFPYQITFWQGVVKTIEGGFADIVYLVSEMEPYLYELDMFLSFPGQKKWCGFQWWPIDSAIVFCTNGKSIMDTSLGRAYVDQCLSENLKKNIRAHEKTIELATSYKNTNYLIAHNIHSTYNDRDDIKKKINDWLTQGLEVLSCVLILMDCKNIMIERTPTINNKNRKILKKEPRYEFHILKIKENRNTPTNSLENSSSLNKRSFHVCRGHYKEYKHESPLFGKFIGRYWWADHVRGDKNMGITEKEYDVSKISE